MNLDDFMSGGSLNTKAESLPQVYNLDDDIIVAKTKELIEAAMNSDKDHEVIEMSKALADSNDEALVLLMLLNKFFYSRMANDFDEIMAKMAITLSMAVMKLLSDDVINDEQAMAITKSIVDAMDDAMDE